MRGLINYILIFGILLTSITFAGWSEPVMVAATDEPVYSELQVRNDSIYVKFGSRFIRSLDGGQTWQDEYTFESNYYLRYQDFQLNGDTIVVFNFHDEFQFYFSTDFGESWQGPRSCFGSFGAYESFNNYHNIIKVCYSYVPDESTSVFLLTSDNLGESWSDPELIWYDAGIVAHKLYTHYDRTYLLYEAEVGDNVSELYILSEDSVGAWHSTFLFDGSGVNEQNHLAASTNGEMAVIYLDWYTFYTYPRLVYAITSSDSGHTWNPVVELSVSDRNYDPKIAISGDTVAAIWEDYQPGRTRLVCRKSFDLGQNWEPPEILTPVDMNERKPDIVIENGKIHIVSFGRDTTAVWYRYWEPGTYVEGVEKPENISLLKAYPNPFNSHTKISFSLEEPSFVEINIYDVLGRRVDKILSGQLNAGYHSINWEASDLKSGTYFLRLNAGHITETRKVVFLK